MKIRTAAIILLLLVLACSCAIPLDQINGGRRTGVVILNVAPPDAEVYLDGYYIGHAGRFDGTHRTLRVALGGHVLKFQAGEFENEMREVIAQEQPQTLVVNMLPKPKPSPVE